MYHLAALQDLAVLKDDPSLQAAVDRLFDNMVDCHLYIHGGIGAMHQWEGFGDNHELPLDGYAETCASIGIMFLGRRMLQHRLDRKVALAMERALYNNIVAGVSLDGTSFFYDQPLATDHATRHSWFEVCCCPPNLSRFLNSLEDYVFTPADGGHGVALNLYIGAQYRSADIEVVVATKYPWEGHVEVSIRSLSQGQEKQTGFAFAMREPEPPYTLSASGYSVRDGYIHFPPKKEWNDTITLSFAITPKLVRSHPQVQATQGMVAVERGPFVYCVETMDSVEPLDASLIDPREGFKEKTLKVADVEVISLRTKTLQMVPYFVWGNRKPGEGVRVWLKNAGDLN
jgi:DUF1680 family protein